MRRVSERERVDRRAAKGDSPDVSSPDLGPLEESVLEQVWRSGNEVSVRDVAAALPRALAYTTVMTTLDRLYRKGLLTRRKEGRAFLYASRTTRAQFTAGFLRRWLERLAGRGTVRPLLASLVEAVGEHDAALLPELQRLVRERERALKRGRP
jgi:predicted transcriptional regulator